MKKKALQIQPDQTAPAAQVPPAPHVSLFQGYEAEREARRLKREQQDNEVQQLIAERVREVANQFGFTLRELWDEVLGGALDFSKVQEFGCTSADGEETLQKGAERLFMNTAGDCVVETSTHSKFVTLRESVQWTAEMHAKHHNDGSHNEKTMTEWLRRVAGEM